MFYLKVENISGKGLNKGTTVRPGLQVFETDKVRVSFLSGALYSFYCRKDNFIFIGESLVPRCDSDIVQAYEDMKRNQRSIVAHGRIPVFAMIDTMNGDIRVFRSISGYRTIYYHHDKGTFICASRLSLIKDDGVKLEIAEERLPEYYVYRYVLPPLTIFKNIQTIPGGWEISYNPSSDQITHKNHWNLERENCISDQAEAIDTTSRLLRDNMELIKGPAQDSAVLLSGGLDSSILGAICQRSNITTMSMSSGFHLITGDSGESDYARSAAKIMGLNHVVYDVSAESYLAGLVDSIAAAEEPVHHLQSVVLNLLFSKGLNSDIKYLFNGEGADALFGNESHMQYWKSRSVLKFTDRGIMKPIINPLASVLMRMDAGDSYFDYNHSDNHDDINHWLWSLEAWGDKNWVKNYLATDMTQLFISRKMCVDNFASWPLLDKITALCLYSDVEETMKIWGKLGEQSGKIVIFPFTHPDVITFIMQVAWSIKAKERKYVLRQVARQLGIPTDIIYRPKKSFGFPIKYWALPDTLFQPLVEMAGEIFDRHVLRSLQTTDQSKAMILWGMLNIYLWRKIFTDNVAPSDLKEEIADRRSRISSAI